MQKLLPIGRSHMLKTNRQILELLANKSIHLGISKIITQDVLKNHTNLQFLVF